MLQIDVIESVGESAFAGEASADLILVRVFPTDGRTERGKIYRRIVAGFQPPTSQDD